MLLRAAKWVAGRMMRLVPERLLGRLLPGEFSYDPNDIPAPPTPPDSEVRLFIAPVNYAGQGWEWARAVEKHIPDAGAVNMVVKMGTDFSHPADNVVPLGFYAASRRWQRAQRKAIVDGFTHVMIEAEKQPFGAVLDESVARQAVELSRSGLEVLMLCHGSDIRLPSRHIANNAGSPFKDSLSSVVSKLERVALENRKVLDTLGFPVFVSTPDLLLDVPYAKWLPVVIDLGRWQTEDLPFSRSRPVVVHAPSKGSVKGSELIDPVMSQLDDEGLIEYRRIEKVPYEQMPEIYRDADIVLDQFRLGDYGVTACEAMAAGRVVIGHVSEHSRAHIRDETGLELPVLEASVESLGETVRGLLTRRDIAWNLAAQGSSFVATVHSGRRSAQALRTALM